MKYLVMTTILLSCTSSTLSVPESYNLYYQLQSYDQKFKTNIDKSSDALWVLDRANFKLYDILNFKNSKRLIYSYMSVGEAETYRDYFKSLPKDIILEENKDWGGNFTVKFWSPEWHEHIYKNDNSYVDQLVQLGFDGVFLDIVDGYRRFPNVKDTAHHMATLIIELAKKARQGNRKFGVFLQNGSEIINDLELKKKEELLNSIQGTTVEGYFFDYRKNPPIPSDYFKTFEPIIKEFKENQKQVFLIEYVKEPELQKFYFNYCREKKLKCLITDRLLKGELFLWQ